MIPKPKIKQKTYCKTLISKQVKKGEKENNTHCSCISIIDGDDGYYYLRIPV